MVLLISVMTGNSESIGEVLFLKEFEYYKSFTMQRASE